MSDGEPNGEVGEVTDVRKPTRKGASGLGIGGRVAKALVLVAAGAAVGTVYGQDVVNYVMDPRIETGAEDIRIQTVKIPEEGYFTLDGETICGYTPSGTLRGVNRDLELWKKKLVGFKVELTPTFGGECQLAAAYQAQPTPTARPAGDRRLEDMTFQPAER